MLTGNAKDNTNANQRKKQCVGCALKATITFRKGRKAMQEFNEEFSFSEWLNEEVKKSEMPKYRFAEMWGVTVPSIDHYLKGERSPRIITVNDLLNVLGKKIVIVDK